MKQLIILITSLLTFSVNAQVIDYNNFDNKLLERLVFEELNKYRDSLGVVDLLWSEVMYKNVSCKQTEILAKGSSLYHPNLEILFTDELRTNISKESQKLTGIESFDNCSPYSVLSMSENGYASDLRNVTYQKMAKNAINAWDRSVMHRGNQKHPYLVKGGGKGFVSISVKLNNSKSQVFIICDFTKVYKQSSVN